MWTRKLEADAPLQEFTMITALLFILPITLLLWALSWTTEKVLSIRQSERDAGKKPSVYL